MSDQQFCFERMDVYQVAYAALKLVVKYRSGLHGLPGEIGPQLTRAAVSTVALITEGFGRLGVADRRNRFAMARGEANEAGGMVELVRLFPVFNDADYGELRLRYLRVTWMLTALME